MNSVQLIDDCVKIIFTCNKYKMFPGKIYKWCVLDKAILNAELISIYIGNPKILYESSKFVLVGKYEDFQT